MPNIDYTGPFALNDDAIFQTLRYAELMFGAVPLTGVEITQQLDPTKFAYTISAQDGRIWSQVIDFPLWPAAEMDPAMTFDVPQAWKKDAEFRYHRPLRDHLIMMINKGLTHLEITWTP